MNFSDTPKQTISDVDLATQRLVEKNFKQKVEGRFQENDLDILLALNRSFADYDRERKLYERNPFNCHEDKENEPPPAKVNWKKRDFDRNKLLAKVRTMEGAKVVFVELFYVFNPTLHEGHGVPPIIWF